MSLPVRRVEAAEYVDEGESRHRAVPAGGHGVE